VKVAEGRRSAKVSPPRAITERMYQRPRKGRFRSKSAQVYSGAIDPTG
jgi:hypothetical protein